MAFMVLPNGLSVELPEGVYAPAEDSDLLLDATLNVFDVSEPGLFIDVGAGSGYVTFSFALNSHERDRFAEFFLVDCNRHSVEFVKAQGRKLSVELHAVRSDLLSCFRILAKPRIVFNAPYLPADEFLDQHLSALEKDALVGGGSGIETSAEFIEQLSSHVMPDSLLVVSSRSELEELKRKIANSGMLVDEYCSVRLFWETVSIWRINRPVLDED